MKIVNKPIKVMAVFYTNGKIEPVKFRLDEEVVRIEKVLKVYTENIVGNDRIVFVCQHNGCDINEVNMNWTLRFDICLKIIFCYLLITTLGLIFFTKNCTIKVIILIIN
ncbi:MAG: hypothetical protein GX285_06155 [Clostridiales bacterium]|nr:hypothetical protein [Clostridiales bacterium]